MASHYQIGRAMSAAARSTPLTRDEMLARLRREVELATDPEDRADAERVLERALTRRARRW